MADLIENDVPQKKFGSQLNQDLTLQRVWFKEMCSQWGTFVEVQTPIEDSKQYSLNGELLAHYNNPITVGSIFEESPTQKTLRKLGWFVEGEEEPIVIHLPYDLPGLQQGTLISVPSAFDNAPNRLFRVTELSTIMVYPASISCKIVPEWEDTAQMAEVHDFTHSNFNMLKPVDEWEIKQVDRKVGK